MFAQAPGSLGTGTDQTAQAARLLKVQKLYVDRLRSESRGVSGVLGLRPTAR
jgi:hypothetical protein